MPSGTSGTGAERAFAGWYVNLQEPFRRTPIGYDTYDLELDVWIPAGGGWSFKDDELLDVRVDEGRFTTAEAAEIRALGAEIGAMLDRGAAMVGSGLVALGAGPALGGACPRAPAGSDSYDVILAALIPALLSTR